MAAFNAAFYVDESGVIVLVIEGPTAHTNATEISGCTRLNRRIDALIPIDRHRAEWLRDTARYDGSDIVIEGATVGPIPAKD